MTGTLDVLSRSSRERARRRAQPSWTAPMLATLADVVRERPE